MRALSAGVGFLVGQQHLQAFARRRRARFRSAVFGHAPQCAAQHAHCPVGALGVAAEPEQIVGHAALDHALRTLHARRLQRRSPQAHVMRLLGVRQHPHVARMPIRCRQRHGAIGIDRHGEPARHGDVARWRPRHEQAHRERLRYQAAVGVDRRLTETDLFFGDETRAVQCDFALQQVLRSASDIDARVLTQRGLPRPARAFLRLADHELVEAFGHMLARLAARRATSVVRRAGASSSPSRCFASLRQVGTERAVLHQRRADGVDDEAG